MLEDRPNLYLVRHAESMQNVNQNLDRDCSLSDLGNKQAFEAGRALRAIFGEENPEAIIHTGLRRTINTAQVIKDAGGFGSPLVEMADFREREMGIYDRMEFSQLLQRNPDIEPLYQQYQGSCIWFLEGYSDDGVEPLSQMQERVSMGLRKIRSQYADKPVVIIGHAGSLKIVRYLYEEVPVRDLARYLSSYVPKNCEIYPLKGIFPPLSSI